MDHRSNGRLGRGTSNVPGLSGARADGAGELLLERTKTLQANILTVILASSSGMSCQCLGGETQAIASQHSLCCEGYRGILKMYHSLAGRQEAAACGKEPGRKFQGFATQGQQQCPRHAQEWFQRGAL